MKILLICTTSGSVANFRRTLIEKLQSENYEVGAVAFDGENKQLIEQRGVKFFCVNDSNRGTNPFKVFSLKRKYFNVIKRFQPDIVFTFMMKPNIFGVRAAKKAGVKKIYSMVEGAGDVFINNGLKWKLIRFAVCKMYKKAFKITNRVFFLNGDDKAEFISRKLVKESKAEQISGIGVDLKHFAEKPLKNYRTFLMIARMLKTKGVIEYCRAARLVKRKYPDAVFNYIGGEGNIKVADIREYIDDKSINYLGVTKDVRPYLEDCAVYVLPSYREGMPVSIMEAEAVGRAVIATNVQGCRSAVKDGYNGYLVEKGSVDGLAEKMLFFLENKDKIEEMSAAGRVLAEEHFDKDKINEKIFGIVGS